MLHLMSSKLLHIVILLLHQSIDTLGFDIKIVLCNVLVRLVYEWPLQVHMADYSMDKIFRHKEKRG